MSKCETYRLHQSIAYQMSVTARFQERRLDDRLRPLGLSRIVWCILLAVGNEGLKQPSDIAGFVGIDRTATSRALRHMEADGMIARQAGRLDRRTTAVEITAHGRSLLDQATPFAHANNAVIESTLSDSELAELHKILAKLRAIEQTPLPKL